MVQWQSGLRLLLVMLFGVISAAPVGASSTPPPYQTATTQWQAAQGAFAGWTLSGVALSGGALTFNGATAQAGTDPYPPGAYNGGNFYNGGMMGYSGRAGWNAAPHAKLLGCYVPM